MVLSNLNNIAGVLFINSFTIAVIPSPSPLVILSEAKNLNGWLRINSARNLVLRLLRDSVPRNDCKDTLGTGHNVWTVK